MKNPYRLLLKCLRKVFGNRKYKTFDNILGVDETSDEIIRLLNSDGGVMIARYGSNELGTVRNYLGVNGGTDLINYIKGRKNQWWWNENLLRQMEQCAGFYPVTNQNVIRFSELMIESSGYLDLLGSWTDGEIEMKPFFKNTKITHLMFLDPYWSKIPWTSALKGKRVLVVHPFAESILNQYKKRELLFNNHEILPQFASLEVIPAVQSIGKGDSRFGDWFQALEWMKQEIDKREYDVCLIGCGAYGFPLAAHVKKQGRKAVHLGGSLQLMFGIRGKRWEDPYYGVAKHKIPVGSYPNLMNEYWIRPQLNETPVTSKKVEGGCYW